MYYSMIFIQCSKQSPSNRGIGMDAIPKRVILDNEKLLPFLPLFIAFVSIFFGFIFELNYPTPVKICLRLNSQSGLVFQYLKCELNYFPFK